MGFIGTLVCEEGGTLLYTKMRKKKIGFFSRLTVVNSRAKRMMPPSEFTVVVNDRRSRSQLAVVLRTRSCQRAAAPHDPRHEPFLAFLALGLVVLLPFTDDLLTHRKIVLVDNRGSFRGSLALFVLNGAIQAFGTYLGLSHPKSLFCPAWLGLSPFGPNDSPPPYLSPPR